MTTLRLGTLTWADAQIPLHPIGIGPSARIISGWSVLSIPLGLRSGNSIPVLITPLTRTPLVGYDL